MSKDRFDIHQHVTDQIVAAIEAGAGEFRLPWHKPSGNITRPRNARTGALYNGVNILSLWAAAELRGFQSGRWATYRQWAELGAQVRKGEKANFVVFYKEIDIAVENEEGDSETEQRLFAKATPVFAAEQVEGFTLPEPPGPGTAFERIAAAEAFVAATGATIQHGGHQACYRPATDTIHMPPADAFIGTATSSPAEAYYSTLFHELTHWTAASSRCDRQLGKRFGDAAYAAEELIAELGAAFLCCDLAITAAPRADHAQYLAHWLTILKSDKKAIFTAAAQASRAASFLHEQAAFKPGPSRG